MKALLRRFARGWLLCSVMTAFAAMAGTSDAADPLDDYNVVWNTPSRDHNGSMPTGNGETGLNLWAEPGGDLVFLVSRTDSWDGNERLCKLGRVRIKFTPSLAGADFKQTLKLRQGEIEIVGGAGDAAVTVRVWVDANRQVAHVEAHSAKDFQMQVALETWRNQQRVLGLEEAHGVYGFNGPITVYPDTVLGGQDNRIAWYYRNTISTWKGTLELQHLQPAIKIGTDPLLHRTFGGVIRGKGLLSVDDRTLKSAKPGKRMEVSLYTETVIPATESQWLAAVEKNIAAAEAVPPDEARAAHRKWWNDFWNRSWIRVTGNRAAEATTRGYVLQRWINACGGRPAIVPAEGRRVDRVGEGENPELYAVFPFRIYGRGKPELEMARHTFAHRGIKCNRGWCQDDTQAAFLGLAGVARNYVSGRATNKHRGSRFPAFWGPNHDWIPDQDHGGNLMMALQTMVLQADNGKILVLPAWPKEGTWTSSCTPRKTPPWKGACAAASWKT